MSSIKKKLDRLFDGWYINQILNLGELLEGGNNQMLIFLRHPSLHELVELFRLGFNFRRNPLQNILFVLILFVLALRGTISHYFD